MRTWFKIWCHVWTDTLPKTNGWIPKMMGLGKGNSLKKMAFFSIYVRFLVSTHLFSSIYRVSYLHDRSLKLSSPTDSTEMPHRWFDFLSSENHVWLLAIARQCVSAPTQQECLRRRIPSWLVLSDEQMSRKWSFSLLNDEQMSNWVGVKHLPARHQPSYSQIMIDVYNPLNIVFRFHYHSREVIGSLGNG